MLIEQLDAFPPRIQMDMGVQYGLSGSKPAIDADIEPCTVES
jgi:hypothetical protein